VHAKLADEFRLTLDSVISHSELCLSWLLSDCWDQTKQAVWPRSLADTICPRPSVILTFDCLTSKLACELHLRWGTFVPNLGTLGLWVLELFCSLCMRQMDRQTDGRTQQRLLPLSTVGGIKMTSLFGWSRVSVKIYHSGIVSVCSRWACSHVFLWL